MERIRKITRRLKRNKTTERNLILILIGLLLILNMFNESDSSIPLGIGIIGIGVILYSMWFENNQQNKTSFSATFAQQQEAKNRTTTNNELSQQETDDSFYIAQALTDEEKATIINEHSLYNQHSDTFQYRYNNMKRLTLKDLITGITTLKNVDYLNLKVVNSATIELNDTDEIEKFDVLSAIIKSNTFSCNEATLILRFKEEHISDRKCIISLSQAGTSQFALYVNIALIAPPTRQLYPNPAVYSETMCTNFCVAYDLLADKDLAAEYDFMYKDMLDKVKDDHEADLTAEQRYLQLLNNPHIGKYMYDGIKHFNQEQYFEAAQHFEMAFKYFYTTANLTEQGVAALADICCRLGFCYNKIGCWKKAFYYLELAVHEGNYLIPSVQEFVEALCNSKDIRALSVISSYLDNLTHVITTAATNGQAIPDEITAHYRFLRQRKVQALIDAKFYDEAEKLLRDLLDNDPVSQDFAKQGLEHLKRIKERN